MDGTVSATAAALAHWPGRCYAALIIGPAGEQGVPAAVVAHQGHYGGGDGVGAALGRQRLKALLIQAKQQTADQCEGCARRCGQPGAAARRANELGIDYRGSAARPAAAHRVEVCDLLGTCRWLWRERPGQILADAVAATQRLLAAAPEEAARVCRA